jgi:hypothetical protein
MTRSIRSTRIAALCALLGAGCSSSDPSVSESTGGNPGLGGGAGTSGSGGSSPGAPQLPACPPDALVETTHANIPAGTYSVPVSAELAPYASYPVGSINFCWNADLVTLGYKLPALVLGKAEHVAFVGPWNPSTARFELSGEDGTGICERAGTTWTCTEEFVSIGVDLTELSKELEGLPAEQVNGRLEVSKLFGQDPIGVLTFVAP